MPGIARVGDADSGHGTFLPDTVKAGSPNVFVNGIPAARTGDPHGVHVNTAPPPSTDGAVCGSGSGSVFVNGIPVFRIGDPVDAATQVEGSENVIAGG